MHHWPAKQKNCTTATFRFCRSSILKFFLYGAPFYAVSTCEAASHGWNFGHQQSLKTQNQLSDFESIFIGFLPHCFEQQWPYDFSVNKDKCSINSKIRNKVKFGSKSIVSLIFKKLILVDPKITRSRTNTKKNSTSSYLHQNIANS